VPALEVRFQAFNCDDARRSVQRRLKGEPARRPSFANGRSWPTTGAHERPVRKRESRRIRFRRLAALERAVGPVWVGTWPTPFRSSPP